MNTVRSPISNWKNTVTKKGSTMNLLSKITGVAFIILLLIGCGASRQAPITTDESGQQANETAGNTAYENAAPLDVGTNSIIDQETGYRWEPYYDNPTTLLRFLIEEQFNDKRLPDFEELTYFFDRLGSELRTNSNGEVAGQMWVKMDGLYISSTESYSAENRKLYRGVSWSYTKKAFESVELAAGELVHIILISQ